MPGSIAGPDHDWTRLTWEHSDALALLVCAPLPVPQHPGTHTVTSPPAHSTSAWPTNDDGPTDRTTSVITMHNISSDASTTRCQSPHFGLEPSCQFVRLGTCAQSSASHYRPTRTHTLVPDKPTPDPPDSPHPHISSGWQIHLHSARLTLTVWLKANSSKFLTHLNVCLFRCTK